MWGNKLGWGIAVGLAIVMVGLMAMLQLAGTQPSTMTARFAADPGNLQPLALPVDPQTVLATTEDCDAADAYQSAIEAYEAHPGVYSPFSPNNVARMEATDLIVEGANCKNLTLFTKRAARVINFDADKPDVAALGAVGNAAAVRANYLLTKGDVAGATKYANAAFSLGEKMVQERVVYQELDAGLGVMGAAAQVLQKIAVAQKDEGRAQQVKAFDDARRKLGDKGSRIADLHAITMTLDGNQSGLRAGDVFALAQKSKERMWRVEACLQLARIHRNVGDEGKSADQRYAQMLLRKLATDDPDAIVRTAATAARDITDAEYFRQH